MQRILSTFMKFIFKHLYHSFAFVYNFIAWMVSGGSWFQWCNVIEQFVTPNSRTLEVGFGTGILQKTLIEKGISVFGLDESVQMVRITKRNLKKHGLKYRLTRADVNELPFSKNSFDLIVSTFPSEFVSSNKFHLELARVLTPGGRFICLLGVEFKRKNLLDAFYRRLYALFNFPKKDRPVPNYNGRKTNLPDRFVIDRMEVAGRVLIFVKFVNYVR